MINRKRKGKKKNTVPKTEKISTAFNKNNIIKKKKKKKKKKKQKQKKKQSYTVAL